MPLFTTALRGREQIARGTMAFRFARPEGFTFLAGQAVNVTLIEPPETDAVAAAGAWGGMADPDSLAPHLRGAGGAMHFLAGPPAMVASLRKALGAIGIAEADVRTDEFYGY